MLSPAPSLRQENRERRIQFAGTFGKVGFITTICRDRSDWLKPALQDLINRVTNVLDDRLRTRPIRCVAVLMYAMLVDPPNAKSMGLGKLLNDINRVMFRLIRTVEASRTHDHGTFHGKHEIQLSFKGIRLVSRTDEANPHTIDQ